MLRSSIERFENRHSVGTTVLSLLVAAAILLFGTPSLAVMAAICFSSVLFIGLPHGGLDHLAGRELLGRFGLPQSASLFGLCYLAVGLIVIAAWCLSPALTIFIFFALSAWHFGLEEETGNRHGLVENLSMFARGGMVIWLPCLAHRESVTALLRSTIPGEAFVEIDWVLNLWTNLLPMWIALLLYDCVAWPQLAANSRTMGWVDHIRWRSLLRYIALAAVMIVADPLVSFTVYFCGWHSIRGIADLWQESRLPAKKFFPQLLPISLLAIGLFLGGWLWSSSILGWVSASVQTTFMGLSAVAIPHLLLHVMLRLVPKQTSTAESWSLGATS
jgi:Brp/Blh family beta-carotene 15,15'-monooxygenase